MSALQKKSDPSDLEALKKRVLFLFFGGPLVYLSHRFVRFVQKSVGSSFFRYRGRDSYPSSSHLSLKSISKKLFHLNIFNRT